MKKLFAFMLAPALACGLAMAQSSVAARDNDKQEHVNNGDTKTMTGCVKEREGRYWLVDKKHPIGVALNSSEDLKAHEGHKISVTGMVSPLAQADAEHEMKKYPEHSASTPDDPLRTSKKDREESKQMKHGLQMMDVSSMQMVSDHCKMK